jgi:hypothetical protein
VVFIFDPFLDALLLIGLIVGWYWRKRIRLAAVASMLAALLYVGVRVELHAAAMSQLDQLVISGQNFEKWAALPTVLDPRIWQGLLESDSGVWRFTFCAPRCSRLDTGIGPRSFDRSSLSDPFDQAISTPSAAALLRFARFPMFYAEDLGPEHGYRVAISDLRFYRESSNTGLVAEITFDHANHIVKETLSFAGPIYRLPRELPDFKLPLKGGPAGNLD